MKFLTKYHPELTKSAEPLEPDLIQADGKRFSINLYGDIVDYDTRKIIARSNLPHNVCTMCGEMKPSDWDIVMNGDKL